MEFIFNPTNPDICNNPKITPDLSKFPGITSNLSRLSASIEPWLCEILKIAGDESVDPVLRPGGEPDYSPFISSLTGMKGVGDPRVDLGFVMQKTMEKYLPLLNAKLKILQDGCQIIEENLCDSDGKPLYKLKSDCDYGEEITFDSVAKFTQDIWDEETTKAANSFADFIKKTYIDKNWKVELIAFGDGDLEKIKKGQQVPVFYAQATQGTGSQEKRKFHKYYFDSKDKVSKRLGIKIRIANTNQFENRDNFNRNFELMRVLSGPYWPE
jgi:hypothetical protein